jgi:TIR domain
VTVFVSYSSRDRDAVKSLTQDLQDADEQVWMDQRLAGGDASSVPPENWLAAKGGRLG